MGFPGSHGCRVIVYKGGFLDWKNSKVFNRLFPNNTIFSKKLLTIQNKGWTLPAKLGFQAVSGPA